jgi:hypothetical protein
MPPFVDLWGWFNNYRVQARRENNPTLLRLIDLFREMWDSFEPDPNQALARCNEAIALARQLKLPCLELFYGYWRCEAYVFYLRQSNMGLKEAVRLALEAQKPEFSQCPVRARVYYALVNAYDFADSYGYAREIEAVLDFMEKDVPLDQDTWRLIAWQRASLAAENEDYEKAFELTEIYRARCGDSKFRLIDAYTHLCLLSYKLKRFDVIGGFAAAGEECARSQNRRRNLSLLLSWKAYALFVAGEKSEARRTAADAIRQAHTVQAQPVYHGPLSYYYEVRGNLDKALQVRREQLELELTGGSIQGEAAARLEICKLYAKMNLPLADELALARDAADRMRRPDQIRDKLDRLGRGEILD